MCSCHVSEDPDTLGYEYIMCDDHYDVFMQHLDAPARELKRLQALFKQTSPWES